MADVVEPALGDVVFVTLAGERELPLYVRGVVGSRGEPDAPPHAHWVELSDGSSWWVTLRMETLDDAGRRTATWVGSQRIWPIVPKDSTPDAIVGGQG